MSNCVCDAAQAFDIYVLIMPQHFGVGVADQGQLVLVRGLDILHQGGEFVTAAVGRGKRQAEGIEAAKANGKKLGRPALTFPANWDKVYASWKAGEITAKTAMEMTETKRTSFCKLASMMEE